ncbi:hypothetical protein FWP33_17005 [Vibrio parahaemolyticus]|uniref:Uncharacterized protein n=1 Tax=Vibrio jasicida TaxID=766224 RepID=A0AAU9QPB8_9VIBR|nr:hypothetical protein [Vibrio parahaemolyticus]ELA8176814.1 hypothetical protein [Vibrio alginolyticus]CAH1593014.1 hypothetical protein THF1C08_320088 [Vibrio jasicida]EJC7176243.1 hypothetical protein [Vibrio parahaemolyticus]EJG0009977.1 hypothetical protein [Vibrio parahaemolyticus]
MNTKMAEAAPNIMSQVQHIDPKNRDNLSYYANAVGALSILCVTNIEALRSFLTKHYGVHLEQLSTLHSQQFSRPIDLDDSNDINAAIDKVLDHFANRNISVKESLTLLFPDCSKEAISSYSEQAAIYAYETVTQDQQIGITREAERENWALCRG